MRVAAIQTTAGPEREANLAEAGALVEEAAGAGAELVVLPEYFSVAGGPRVLRERAEPLGGPTLRWAADQARRWRIQLVAGSFPERPRPGTGADERLFNTSCVLDPEGRLIAVYRKVHLFDPALDGAGTKESDTMAPGDDLTVVPLAGRGPGRDSMVLGVALCYDLRFPEQFRIMALRGADVLVVPAAFTAVTGAAHWELLVRARAVENAAYVVAAGQVGRLPAGMPECHGHSMVVDPWGSVLAQRTEPGPGVVVADAAPSRVAEVRTALPVLAHRRPDAYRWPDEHPGHADRPD